MTTPDKAASLKRMKTLATALLVVVTLLFVVARREGWPWLAAFAEAAMIGALADWFAVVALFRHPLGLPIPHTAILPRNKARLADNLARFIRDRFLDTASLVARLRAADPASRIGVWLQQPDNARALSDRLGVILVQSLDFMDDRRVRRLLVHALRKRAAGLDLAGAVGRILDALTENRRHQAGQSYRPDIPHRKTSFTFIALHTPCSQPQKVCSFLAFWASHEDRSDAADAGVCFDLRSAQPSAHTARSGRTSDGRGVRGAQWRGRLCRHRGVGQVETRLAAGLHEA